MPHMMTPLEKTAWIQNPFEIACARRGGMTIQRPFARTLPDRLALRRVECECVECVASVRGGKDFFTGFEELIEALPDVADDRRAARGGFKQTARWAIPHLRHRAARHIQRQPRRTVEGGMLGRRQMPDIVDVRFPRKALGILR